MQTLTVTDLATLGAPEHEDIVRQHGAQSRDALHSARRDVLSALRALMAPDCSTDATGLCTAVVEHVGNPAIRYTCGILCAPVHACNDCHKVLCFPENHLHSCDQCLQSYCDDCMRGPFVGGEYVGGVVCEICARAMEEDMGDATLRGPRRRIR